MPFLLSVRSVMICDETSPWIVGSLNHVPALSLEVWKAWMWVFDGSEEGFVLAGFGRQVNVDERAVRCLAFCFRHMYQRTDFINAALVVAAGAW